MIYARACLSAGFTLLEALVVLVVMGVLAAVAYPTYERHIITARRTAAGVCLVESRLQREMYFARYLHYDQAPLASCSEARFPHYRIVEEPGQDAWTYRLVAEPLGRQAAADAGCGALWVDQLGRQGIDGTSDDAGKCWAR